MIQVLYDAINLVYEGEMKYYASLLGFVRMEKIHGGLVD